MKIKAQYEYPCGYKYIVEIRSLFLVATSEDDVNTICPMHKQKCHKAPR